MSKTKGSNASGKFPKKAGRGTAQTQPPKATHYRCPQCYTRVHLGEYCRQDHEKLRFDNAVAVAKDAGMKHGQPISDAVLSKMRRAWARGDHATILRIRPNPRVGRDA